MVGAADGDTDGDELGKLVGLLDGNVVGVEDGNELGEADGE